MLHSSHISQLVTNLLVRRKSNFQKNQIFKRFSIFSKILNFPKNSIFLKKIQIFQKIIITSWPHNLDLRKLRKACVKPQFYLFLNLYFLLHNWLLWSIHNSYNIPLDWKFWDFMDSCSLFLLLLTFFGGYDLYIIAIISPLEPERAAKARSAVVASDN